MYWRLPRLEGMIRWGNAIYNIIIQLLMKSDFLNKNEIYKIISKQNKDLSEDKIRIAVDTFFDEISVALASGDDVQLRNFASMSVRKRGG